MGYSIFDQVINGVERDAGYGVIALCDHPNCTAVIDRGMGYACCDAIHHDGSCGGFYCSEHIMLWSVISKDEFEGLDDKEIQKLLEQYGLSDQYSPSNMPEFNECEQFNHCQHEPIQSKTAQGWVDWIKKDDSWGKWRELYPEKLQFMIEDAAKWEAVRQEASVVNITEEG